MNALTSSCRAHRRSRFAIIRRSCAVISAAASSSSGSNVTGQNFFSIFTPLISPDAWDNRCPWEQVQ